MSFESDFSEDECCADYEFCSRRRSSATGLPFDPSSIEDIILKISDKFNFRVLMNSEKAKGAVLVTTGLALAGGLIGKAYGGKMGAAVGGAVGGVCGIGLVAISMRDIWKDLKPKLAEIFDLVYDYLSGLGLDDYKKAATLLSADSPDLMTLATLIMQTSSSILGKKVLSSLPGV
ncbi:hypothetical protein MSG28_011662 [Choristoneura fumiferana]|uniref:Uncharacterized protein n=1 Tax=Choristoneura fumiferana TaxID=7141 RepID=A0ACC0KLW9_CHOFU|nr:hypothetical protein MSG28_011662 [Choristoneura fumiferana]